MLVRLAIAFTLLGAQTSAQHAPVVRREAHLLYTIGSADADVRNPDAFSSIKDVQVAPDGRIYVLDPLRHEVRILSPEGARLSAFGRRGVGDGQWTRPAALDVTGNTVVVRDDAQRKWLTFSLSGRHLSTRPLYPGEFWLQRTYPMRGGAAVIETMQELYQRREEVPGDEILHRIVSVRLGTRAATKLFTVRTDTLLYKPRGAGLRAVASRFGAGGAWAIHGDSLLAHADGGTGNVVWYSIGAQGPTVARRASLGRRATAVTPADIDVESRRIAAVVSASLRPPNRAQRSSLGDTTWIAGVPSVWSVATRALFSDDGALWVGINRIYSASVDSGTMRVGEENTWTVFPARGDAFTVTLRPLFRLTAVAGSRLYGYVDDGGEDRRVYVYTLPATSAR